MCRSRRIIFRVNSLSSYLGLVPEIKEVVKTVQELLVSTKPFHWQPWVRYKFLGLRPTSPESLALSLLTLGSKKHRNKQNGKITKKESQSSLSLLPFSLLWMESEITDLFDFSQSLRSDFISVNLFPRLWSNSSTNPILATVLKPNTSFSR